MKNELNDYLGAIEVVIDGFQYEIGLRKDEDHRVRGLWTCLTCDSTGVTSESDTLESNAIELARHELFEHHAEHHLVHRARGVKKPR